jgi:hypothetical protein
MSKQERKNRSVAINGEGMQNLEIHAKSSSMER